MSLGRPCLPLLLGPRVPGGPSARRRAVMVLGSLLSSGRRLSTCHFKGLSRELLIRCCELQRKRGRTLLGPWTGRWCQRQSGNLLLVHPLGSAGGGRTRNLCLSRATPQ